MKLLNFDLFTKFQDPSLTDSSRTGGLFTILVFMTLTFISYGELKDAVAIKHNYEYLVDSTRSTTPSLQINIDMTVNMPCQFIRIDALDVSREIIMLKNKIQTFDVDFSFQGASHVQDVSSDSVFGSFGGGDQADIFALQHAAYRSGSHGDLNFGKGEQACRFVGSFNVQKVSGMLHVTALGHGYGGMHVDHSLMNFTHRIDRLSFGPLYPGLKNPLDHTLEVALEAFGNFQYFVAVVPTIYVNHATMFFDSILLTNQYSVTEHYKSMDPDHPESFPGIFIKYEIEPISVRITAKRMAWVQFLTRFCGIIGGVFVSVGYIVRLFKWIKKKIYKKEYSALKVDE